MSRARRTAARRRALTDLDVLLDPAGLPPSFGDLASGSEPDIGKLQHEIDKFAQQGQARRAAGDLRMADQIKQPAPAVDFFELFAPDFEYVRVGHDGARIFQGKQHVHGVVETPMPRQFHGTAGAVWQAAIDKG